MRIGLGVLSFCVAGWLALFIVPVAHQVVLPYLLHGNMSGYSLWQIGPIRIYEPQISILSAVLALLVVALIAGGIRAFKIRGKTHRTKT